MNKDADLGNKELQKRIHLGYILQKGSFLQDN